MKEKGWLACENPTAMFAFLCDERGESRRKSGRRKLRLFACACIRDVVDLLREPGSHQALECAERFADGHVSEQELNQSAAAAQHAMWREGWSADRQSTGQQNWQAAEAATHVARKNYDGRDHPSVRHAAFGAANAWAFKQYYAASGEAKVSIEASRKQRQTVQTAWLRDIFGNPFRPATFDPAWRTSTAVALASQMYESRDFGALPILADALQDAGCGNEDILNHCREPGPHVRGCWVVDLVLGKS